MTLIDSELNLIQPAQRQIIRGPEFHYDGQDAPETWPSVSLCMIVKNEEENIAACLKTVGDFPHEIVIVDTGSTDRTVEIARSFGARVQHFQWVDDFAAARNESLKYATGDWIFWMDADDRLAPTDLIRLKQAVASNLADVYMCRIVSASMDKENSEAIVEHLRLFRNHRSLEFRGALHESILSSAQQQGMVIARTNISVEHTGYNIDIDDYKAKGRRNLTIINRKLAQNPDDLYWRYHRAASLTIMGNLDQAAEDYEAVIADPPAELHWDIYVYQAHTGLIHIYYDQGKQDDVYRVLDQTLERFPERRHLAILAGMVYMNYDEMDKALAALQRARQLSPASDLLGQVWPPGRLERTLGQIYLMLGRSRYARDAYQAMLAAKEISLQLDPPAHLAEARNLFEQQAYEAAAKSLLPAADGNPAALRLLAETQHRRQQWRSAAACLAQAIALTSPEPGEWVRLAEFVLHTRHFTTAERLCQLALAENQTCVEALNLLGFVAIQKNQAEQAMAYLLQAYFNNPDHTWVRQNLEQLAQVLELSLEDAICQYGTHMLAQKKLAFAAVAFTVLIQLTPHNAQPYRSLAVALNGLGRDAEAMEAWQTAQLLGA